MVRSEVMDAHAHSPLSSPAAQKSNKTETQSLVSLWDVEFELGLYFRTELILIGYRKRIAPPPPPRGQ